MIKRMRQKFILITMGTLLLVLGILVAAINLANYTNVNRIADDRLAILAENSGRFPRMDEQAKNEIPFKKDISPEAPFETRYFTVVLNNGTVRTVDTGRIAAVSTETAVDYARELYQKGKEKGFLKNYKYRAIAQGEDVMYIFLDCGREMDTFRSFLVTSLLISFAGLLLVFLLLLLLSGLAVRPFAESYAKQKRFITDAGHELKTPLAIIQANTEVLELDGQENEWTRSIKNQVGRLGELTNQLIFLARMDEAGNTFEMLDFSISEAVLETAGPFAAVAMTQQKELKMDVERKLFFHGNEASIRQIVSILLDNALKYSPKQTVISLCLRAAGKRIELTVANSAEGMEPGNLDCLFERFYRRDSSRNSQTGGHGIGLSVAKAITEAHKGRIMAKCVDGKEIVFTVLL